MPHKPESTLRKAAGSCQRAPSRRGLPLAAWGRRVVGAVLALAAFAPGAAVAAAPGTDPGADPGPSTALFYGSDPPWNELAAFDQVVLDPGHGFDIASRSAAAPRTRWLAYVAVGEVHPTRPYLAQLPPAWRLGANTDWGSVVVDTSQPDWPRWFVEHVARPQWQRGFRGFFLDTMDSYQIVAKTDAERAAHEAGLVRVVLALREAFPEARLVLNRGFEILPQVHKQIDMVAAESLYRRWEPKAARYAEVPVADREWLLAQLQRVRREYRRPVLAIDYVAPTERERARSTAAQIRQHGFVPWVGNPALDVLGVGSVEVLPRQVLMLHDTALAHSGELTYLALHRHYAMPLNHLGLLPRFVDVDRQPLPAWPLAGRIAAVVTRFERDVERPELAAWLQRAIAEGVRVVSVGLPGLGAGAQAVYGMRRSEPGASLPLTLTHRDPVVGFELLPQPNAVAFQAFTVPGAQPLLQWRDATGATMDAAALTPWGAYLLPGFGVARVPGPRESWRWVVDPVAFLQRALALPDMPVPDTTTDSGRRMLLVHVDGDGMANRSELPGGALAGEVLLREVLQRYRVPTTVSVIEGEVSPEGIYAAHSAAMEDTARRMFALPHVELASHTYSHPFRWAAVERGSSGDRLPIPGYRFDPVREVAGSIRYIEQRLAPPGKKVQLLLWSGDTNPTETTLAAVAAAGVLAMNGGETVISRGAPSLTEVAPLGIPKGPYFQVYAPNQNENVYTNLFTGPFYGYERVLETFDMTERPYRIKPVNVYYHTYSASKRASLEALHKVYRAVLAMPLHPVHASDYVRRAQAFGSVVVARSEHGFVVRNLGALRQLRMAAAAGLPQFATSPALAGYNEHAGQRYLHLAADAAELRFAPAGDGAAHLVDANARVLAMRRDGTRLTLELQSHMPLQLGVMHAPGCRATAAGAVLRPVSVQAGLHRYQTAHDGTTTFSIECP